MSDYIRILIGGAALLYGGIVDFRRREIPDAVPIILIGIGILFGFPLFWSILGLVVSAALMLFIAKFTKSTVPGGDLKLLCALGFACGLPVLGIVILMAGIGAFVHGIVMRRPLLRNVPICSYVAPAYIAFHLIALAMVWAQGG